jgi:hypothetical protein
MTTAVHLIGASTRDGLVLRNALAVARGAIHGRIDISSKGVTGSLLKLEKR